MTICPIALAIGCRKCPIFAVCPAKSVIGDYKKEADAPGKGASARPNAASDAAAPRPTGASARPKSHSKRRAKNRR